MSQYNPLPPTAQGGDYHVIVGSSPSKSYAEEVAEGLRKKGYKSVKVISGDGKHRVAIASYQTADAADAAAAEFRKSQHNNSIWVLNQKITQ
ncbi:MAG: SPOR domain-containing protein [Bacteroidales bacterium]|nr:SPOR domain-containing protein [Bacteroidales bacterium]